MSSLAKQGNSHRTSVASTNGLAAADAAGADCADVREFSRLRTVPWAALHAALAVGVALYAVVAAARPPALPPHECTTYRVAVLLHVALWFCTLVVDWVLKRQQHALRVAGYLQFYQRTYALHRAPLYCASAASAVLLMAVPLEPADCAGAGLRAPRLHVAAVLAADALALLALHAIYIYRVWSFNTAEARPDVHEQTASAVTLASSVGSHRSTLTQTADLLARQADLIRHLREHNEKLSTQLSAANSELRDLRHRTAAPPSAAAPPV